MRITNDERLVTLLRDGDAAAFEVIYDRHHRPILAFARHMLGDRHEAEDVVQHTFFAAYRDLTSNDRDYHVRAWLFTIARNRCLTLLRARRERVDLDEAEPSTDGLAAEIERRQELRSLLGDLSRLPDDQREALLLTELSAMDHVAVATVLKVPKDKVKALVFQARTTLAADRAAREMSCDSIRERLANARGGELRRGMIRRHLRDCESCRDFRSAVAYQRRAAAVILPVLPSAGLKTAALSAIAGGSAGGGTVGAGIISALGANSVASKGLVIAAIAGTGTAGVATVDALRADGPSGSGSAGETRLHQMPVRDTPFTSIPARPRIGQSNGSSIRQGSGQSHPGSHRSQPVNSTSHEVARRLSRHAGGIAPSPSGTTVRPPAAPGPPSTSQKGKFNVTQPSGNSPVKTSDSTFEAHSAGIERSGAQGFGPQADVEPAQVDPAPADDDGFKPPSPLEGLGLPS